MTFRANSPSNKAISGCVALILHAHIPYVRHLHEEGRLEERWFFEAMTDTYIPLLDAFERLTAANIPFRLTMTLTPSLLALMEDPLMQTRYEEHLKDSIRLAELEIDRLQAEPTPLSLAQMYAQRWQTWLAHYKRWDRDLIGRFRHYYEQGSLELITCAATHGYLPLIKHDELIQAQIEIGAREHERHFGVRPRGIWLPECAYESRLMPMLHRSGLQYFIVDSHALLHAEPTLSSGTMHPVRLQSADSIYAFARDKKSSEQVWSMHEGYPGDPEYREYYRDIGHDLGWHSAEEWEYIKPFLLSDGARINTGMKYYRVTGADGEKDWYHPESAHARLQEHARHFIESRMQQIEHYWKQHPNSEHPPIVVSPYDAELFGHWWYEGPQWIEALFRALHEVTLEAKQHLSFISPADYIDLHPTVAQASIAASSWGRGGYSEVWLMERNDWIYRHLHQTEHRLIACLNTPTSVETAHDFQQAKNRISNQAIRELLLAQSSDWAFILDADTVPSYATERVQEHLLRCHSLLDMLERGSYDEQQLDQMEEEYPCFPSVDYRLFMYPASPTSNMQFLTGAQSLQRSLLPTDPVIPTRQHAETGDVKRILMLAWEFPPLVIGGLSRAVYDLSRNLANEQCEVHVLTREVPDSPPYEQMEGVHVHRVPLHASNTPVGFLDWVIQMNAALIDGANQLITEKGLCFDFLHAHDWLVYPAAKELKHIYRIPLIATIHATEHGRNNGTIHTPLQQRIHRMEHELVHEANHVIVCSQAMVEEIHRLFGIPHSRIAMIPNGVAATSLSGLTMKQETVTISAADFTSLPKVKLLQEQDRELLAFRRQYAKDDEQILFFIGRLVYEKGIQVLIQALPLIRERCAHVRLILAGTGPMTESIRALVHELKLESFVHLTGFVNDDNREKLFRIADVCVFPSLYEPFGIVALEAMEAGIPVVVSDTGGLAEIIEHAHDGYKALPGHVESLAWHTADLLEHREKAFRFAKAAKFKARTKYDWNTIAVSTRNVYEGVIAQ